MSKILIIEDEPAIRRVLVKILTEEDKSHEISEAENGIDAINQLKKKSSHINARNFQDVYRRKSFFSFIDDWKSSLDLFFNLEETNKDIARLSSISNFEEIMDIFPSKYFIKPSINGYEETPRIFNFITDVENLIKNINNFEDTLKDEIIGESKIEITRAVNQLQEAALLLDEDSQNKINEIVLKIENTEYQDYPKHEIAQAFDKFNEPMLKAKLESLNVDLASLSFQKARFNWSKKISNDQNLQNSIAALSRKLNYSKGVIDEKSFVDFKRALKAIPIWISTAQSSQSIPMIPGLFDIVIIDEASQCTVTNALPLVYRGKSLAIIGDPEQLTSIPSIQREEENSIFEQFSYDNALIKPPEKINNKVYQRVHPTLIKKSSYIASIDGVLNAVITNGFPVGESVIQGEGAGPEATTSALVSDISSILRGNVKFPFSVSSKERKVLKFNNISSRYFSAYLRFEVVDKPGVLSNITNIFSKNKVSIKRLVQNPDKNKKSSSIVIITHICKDKYLKKILKETSKKNYIKRKPKLIRIDNN